MLGTYRYLAEKESEWMMTSYWKIKFLAGEYYHVAHYDQTHVVVMGLFDTKRNGRMEIKPFVSKEDCKKYLIHKP